MVPDEVNSLAVSESSIRHVDTPWVCCARAWWIMNEMRVEGAPGCQKSHGESSG